MGSSTGMHLSAKKCFTARALWSGALSCCRIHDFFLPQFRPFLPHSFSELGQDLQVVLLINRLTLRSTISLLFSKFSSVFDVEGGPGLSSSSTSSRPYMNRLCHSKARFPDITLSSYTHFNGWKHSVGVFFSISQEISDWRAARFSS
jgi:hypothetical protein